MDLGGGAIAWPLMIGVPRTMHVFLTIYFAAPTVVPTLAPIAIASSS